MWELVPVNPVLGKKKQEDLKFVTRLNCMGRSCLNNIPFQIFMFACVHV